MRKGFAVLIAFVVGLLIVVPVAVLAGSGRLEGELDRQAAAFPNDPVSTWSMDWTDARGSAPPPSARRTSPRSAPR